LSTTQTRDPAERFSDRAEDYERVFEDHAENGRIAMLYDTHLYFGRLDS
jgi:hypothetical protein